MGYVTGTPWTALGYATVTNVNASLNLYPTNVSVGTAIAPFATNASVGIAIQNFATNASVNTALNPFATNASVGTALNKYVPNASIGTSSAHSVYWGPTGYLEASAGTGGSGVSQAYVDGSLSTLNSSIGTAAFAKNASLGLYALAIGFHTISVSTNAPASPVYGDLWIDTSI
jgi:hypothetical protein